MIPMEPGYHKEPVCGIYAIVHAASGRHYIGSSIDVRRRLASHYAILRRGLHVNQYLQAAWNKYGAGEFQSFLLERCASESLSVAEARHLQASNLFNVCASVGLPPSRKGAHLSESAKQKLRTANLGKRYGPRRPESRLKSSLSNKGRKRAAWFGPHMSKVLTGRSLSPEHRAAISRAHLGKPKSPQHRANISAGRKALFQRLAGR